MKVAVTNKSVRDFPVKVIVDDDNVQVKVKLGRQDIGTIAFPRSHWPTKPTAECANLNWLQHTCMRNAFRDYEDEESPLRDRIADGAVVALNQALAKYNEKENS